jgi:hypothetical protein
MITKLHVFAAASFFLMANIVTAQQILQEISMKPGYSDQVYVSLEKGVSKSIPLSQWDIGFQITGISSSIIVNEGKGLELYYVTGSTEETFAQKLNEVDIAQWERVINSPLSWNNGAFNRGYDFNTGNFGWGDYNTATHTVTGTSVYVVKFPDKSFKKLFINGLVGGKYMFKYANLDGTEEKSGEVAKSDFAGRNFGYFDLLTAKTIDIEPETNQWDLLFSKYVDYTKDQSGNELPYVVSGIRTNTSVTVAKVPNGAASNNIPDISAFSTNINTIGYNWKSFTGGAWILDTTTAYYVKNQNNKIYKIVFKRFGGSTTGTTTFMQEDVTVSSLNEDIVSAVSYTKVFPTVVQSGASLTVQSNSNSSVQMLYLYDNAGNEVYKSTLMSGNTSTTVLLPILATGQYTLMVSNGLHTEFHKIIVRQ